MRGVPFGGKKRNKLSPKRNKLSKKGTSKNSEQVITCIKVGHNKDIIRTKPDYTKTEREKDKVKESKMNKNTKN